MKHLLFELCFFLIQFALLFNNIIAASQTVLATRQASLIKIFDFMPGFFTQAARPVDYKLDINKFFYRAAPMNQFTTLAIFDVTPFWGDFAKAYADVRAQFEGWAAFSGSAVIDKIVAGQDRHLIFFIQTDIKNSKSKQLNSSDCAWKLFLKMNNRQILPESIVEADNDAVFKTLIADRFDRLKKTYRVTFDLGPQAEVVDQCSLLFKSLDSEAEIKINYSN